MAWIQTIARNTATGELLEVYQALAARQLPPVYIPLHGDAAGIQRAHSLDPLLMKVVFATTGSMHQGEALTWAERELVAALTSRAGQCFY
jgi:hypothetical protein